MERITKKIGAIIGITTSVFFFTVVVLAWTSPSSIPPICPSGEIGCDLAIHIGAEAQSKSGGLLLNTGGIGNGLIVENGNVGIGITTPSAKLNVKGGGIKIDPDTAEKPTCDATTRGTMWAEYSDVSGEGDEFFYCRKNSYDNYEWQAIVTDEL